MRSLPVALGSKSPSSLARHWWYPPVRVPSMRARRRILDIRDRVRRIRGASDPASDAVRFSRSPPELLRRFVGGRGDRSRSSLGDCPRPPCRRTRSSRRSGCRPPRRSGTSASSPPRLPGELPSARSAAPKIEAAVPEHDERRGRGPRPTSQSWLGSARAG